MEHVKSLEGRVCTA